MAAAVSLREREHGTAVHKGWEANLSTAGELRVRLFGDWNLASDVRSSAELSRRLSETPRPTKISFDVRDFGAWDNILIEFLIKLEAIAGERGVEVDRSALPGGVDRLVASPGRSPNGRGRGTYRRLSTFSPGSVRGALVFLRQLPISLPSWETRSSGSADCSSGKRGSGAPI